METLIIWATLGFVAFLLIPSPSQRKKPMRGGQVILETLICGPLVWLFFIVFGLILGGRHGGRR